MQRRAGDGNCTHNLRFTNATAGFYARPRNSTSLYTSLAYVNRLSPPVPANSPIFPPITTQIATHLFGRVSLISIPPRDTKYLAGVGNFLYS